MATGSRTVRSETLRQEHASRVSKRSQVFTLTGLQAVAGVRDPWLQEYLQTQVPVTKTWSHDIGPELRIEKQVVGRPRANLSVKLRKLGPEILRHPFSGVMIDSFPGS